MHTSQQNSNSGSINGLSPSKKWQIVRCDLETCPKKYTRDTLLTLVTQKWHITPFIRHTIWILLKRECRSNGVWRRLKQQWQKILNAQWIAFEFIMRKKHWILFELLKKGAFLWNNHCYGEPVLNLKALKEWKHYLNRLKMLSPLVSSPKP